MNILSVKECFKTLISYIDNLKLSNLLMNNKYSNKYIHTHMP